MIQGEFPGSQVVGGPPQQQYSQPQYTTPSPQQGYTLTIKGNQYGPIPPGCTSKQQRRG